MINAKIRQILEQDWAITVAYLYGSYARGRANKFSDVDVAVLFDPKMPESRYSSKQLKLIQAISEAAGKEADVTVLNRAPTFLKYQILKDGTRVYEKPGRNGRLFEARALIEYFDYLPFRARIDNAMIKRIKGAH